MALYPIIHTVITLYNSRFDEILPYEVLTRPLGVVKQRYVNSPRKRAQGVVSSASYLPSGYLTGQQPICLVGH